MLPRSSGGLLITASPSQDAVLAGSTTAAAMSDHIPPLPEPKRRSTGASDALQYYWSTSAGERSSSFSSSVGKSPVDSSPRPGILSSPYTRSPPPPLHGHSGSHVSLRDLVEQEAEHQRRRASASRTPPPKAQPIPQGTPNSAYVHNGSPRDPDLTSSAGPSNRRIHLVSYPSDGVSTLESESSSNNITPPSPSGSSRSAESAYSMASLVDDGPPRVPSPPLDMSTVRVSRANRGNRRGLVETDGNLGGLLDPPFDEWAAQRSWETPSPGDAGVVPPQEWRTPRQSDIIDCSQTSPGWASTFDNDRTPRNSGFQTAPSSSSRPPSRPSSSKTTHSGRLLFVAPPDVSRRSLDELQRDISGLGFESRGARGEPPRVALSINSDAAAPLGLNEPETPHSAPAHKTAFDHSLDPGERERERARPASLLPPITSPSLDRPLHAAAAVPRPSASPALSVRSPEPPPRSDLRRPTPTPPLPPKKTLLSSPDEQPASMSVTPPLPTLPTIVNTPHSPDPPSRASTVPPTTPGAVGVAGPSSSSPPLPLTTSSTIQDLTNILGGAIDEIGLVDSRDVPPPTVIEPVKLQMQKGLPLPLHDLPPRSTSSANAPVPPVPPMPAAQDTVASLSPTSAAFGTTAHHRGASSSSGLGFASTGMATSARGNVSRHVRKASSILSLRSSNYGSPTAATFTSPQSLPPAVLYGNIKTLRTSRERARAYARSIAELSRADSGLRDMCATIQYSKGPLSRGKNAGAQASLGISNLNPPQPRNVSTGSEFPMRADAYSAREIAVRNLEPSDEPTALPPNLPFPALQLQNVAVKASGSMQSLASAAPSRRPAFLSAFGRLKKDRDNATLPAPTGVLLGHNQAASSSKRDLRSLAFSGSASNLLGSRRNSLDSSETVRAQQQAAQAQALPLPREPLADGMGLAAMRNSLEAPLPRPVSQTPPRNSLDSSLNSSRSSGLTGPRPLPSSSISNPAPYMTTPSPLSRARHTHGHGHGHDSASASGGVQLHDRFASAASLPGSVPGTPGSASGPATEPNEEDVRRFSDLIPHAERAVARAYLVRYGEMHNAVSAFFEDEKKGTVMRV